MTIAVIGLGYVGLPLALEFSKKYKVWGIDINKTSVEESLNRLNWNENNGNAKNHEKTDKEEIGFNFIDDLKEIKNKVDFFIITVPTPIDSHKQPDLQPLKSATQAVAKVMEKGSTVIFESTVYPGCTEEICVPILSGISGLQFNEDFFVGYSPERINIGDTIHTLTNIIKITSGSNPESAEHIDQLYRSIISAGTYKANSIKVAEAAKAIENAQRDLNISFVNELALIFDKMDIDTNDVLEASATKWNFLKFKPGLVGGHCIGVDPYYLTFKSKQLGYEPKVILSGRNVNEDIPAFVASKTIKLINEKKGQKDNPKILVLGITFKEHCDDIRSSKVINLYHELKNRNCSVDIWDPWADIKLVKKEYSLHLLSELNYANIYDGIILAVAHKQFSDIDYLHFKNAGAIIFDIKSFLPRHLVDGRL